MYAMTLDDNLQFCWKEVSDPVRKPGEVLIKTAAAAVNRADLMQKDGCYASPPDWPQWCGLEVAGTVLEAPEESPFKPGDKVCALLGGGGYSEKVTVPAGMVLPVPENCSMEEAATLPEVWSTVYLNVVLEAGGLRPGDVFFVQAGASGIGLAAIQFAKLCGARVITTAAPEKADYIKALGADIVLDSRKDDLRPVFEANPPDMALDCVGGALQGEYLAQMKFGGRWVMIATLAGGQTTIDLEQVWRKRLKLIGSTLRSRTPEEKAHILDCMQKELWPLFAARKLVTRLHGVFPIQDVEKAHAVLRRRENIGKVVLTFK
ncbi:MAG: NAD(P)H-quinone oxidoreductase [Lentisphaeria bacterium]|nr:NAD(P)H-quinone oxidoreductase [Lentisphaeria bacterium]